MDKLTEEELKTLIIEILKSLKGITRKLQGLLE